MGKPVMRQGMWYETDENGDVAEDAKGYASRTMMPDGHGSYVRENAVEQEEVSEDEEVVVEQDVDIEAIIGSIYFAISEMDFDDRGIFTEDGKPEVEYIRGAIELDITAEERDEAWGEFLEDLEVYLTAIDPPEDVTGEQDDSPDPTPEEIKQDKIINAIGRLDFDDKNDFTQAGKPQVDRIETISNLDVTADERDACWTIFLERVGAYLEAVGTENE